MKLQRSRVVTFACTPRSSYAKSLTAQKERVQEFVKRNKMISVYDDVSENGAQCPRKGLPYLIDRWITNPEVSDFDFVLMHNESVFSDSREAKLFDLTCRRNNKLVIYTESFTEKELSPKMQLEKIEGLLKEERSIWRGARIREGIYKHRIASRGLRSHVASNIPARQFSGSKNKSFVC